MLSTINSTIELFTMGSQSIDFNSFPPFVNFLIYKAAAITTERLLIDRDSTDGVEKLRTLRKFLGMVAERWLGCGKLSRGGSR